MPWDHPRIRGTNDIASTFLNLDEGSSPHTRDKSDEETASILSKGSIPAYAGQIYTTVIHEENMEEHPRIRGTNIDEHLKGIVDKGASPHTRDKSLTLSSDIRPSRITPAYAGQIQRERMLSFSA